MVIVEWARAIISRLRRKPVNLVELFKDYKVEIQVKHKSVGKGGKVYGDRLTLYEIIPKKNPKRLTPEDIKKYVDDLSIHHPEEGFVYVKKVISGREYHIITKMNSKSNKPNVPIYFDLERQRFFIEKESTKTPSITNYIIMITLGKLGVTQSKYVSSRLVKNDGD